MRVTLIVIFGLVVTNCNCQLLNGSFEEWLTIETGLGSISYENPKHWNTSNNVYNFRVNETVFRSHENIDGFYSVKIKANDYGIDDIGSGYIWQRIPIDGLIKLSYSYLCDSIVNNGSCLVNISSHNEIIYQKEYFVENDEFLEDEIIIETLDLSNSDTIDIWFIANGGDSFSDTIPRDYSEFIVENVNSEYISSNEYDPKITGLEIYPNPTNDRFKVESKLEFTNMFLLDTNGNRSELLMEINTKKEFLVNMFLKPSGVYYLYLEFAERKSVIVPIIKK